MMVSRAVVAFALLLGLLGSRAQAGVVFLVRIGTDAYGAPLFRPADSRDGYLAGLFGLAQTSTAINEVSRYYDQVQRDRLSASLQGRGLSAADIQYATQNAATQPVYVELNGSNSGTYNDWKGTFSIQYANGQTARVQTPRVVFPLAGDVARSGDPGLIEQTLVHEIGHGAMAQAVGVQNLPSSPYLSKPHSGGSVTDPQLGFIEGWAEFIGAYFTGRHTIAEDPARSLDTNAYAKNANGSFKTPQQLVSDEGWCASVMLAVAEQGASQNAMWKMTQAMSRTSPQSTYDLLRNTAAMFPELAPTINTAIYQYSGGQIAGPAPQAGYAQVPGTAGNTGTANAPSNSGPAAPLTGNVAPPPDIGGAAAAPAPQDATTDAPQTYTATPDETAPGTAAEPTQSYTNVVSSLNSNDTGAAASMMDAYRAQDAARRSAAAAANGPVGER